MIVCRGSLCCGLAFSSRGMVAAGDAALGRLVNAIEDVRASIIIIIITSSSRATQLLRRRETIQTKIKALIFAEIFETTKWLCLHN